MNKNEGKCEFCEVERVEGIHIMGLFLCESCEGKILLIKPNQRKYDHYVGKIKRIYYESIISQ